MPESIISQYRREYNSPIETSRQVATVTERDNISTLRRWEGMLVYVVTDGITYELNGGTDNTFWVPMVGIGEAPEDGNDYVRRDGSWELASSGIPDAPSDGNLYGRQDADWEEIVIPGSFNVSRVDSETTSGTGTLSYINYDVPSTVFVNDGDVLEFRMFLKSSSINANTVNVGINLPDFGSSSSTFSSLTGNLNYVLYGEIMRISSTELLVNFRWRCNGQESQNINIYTTTDVPFPNNVPLFVTVADTSGANNLTAYSMYLRKKI